MGYVVFHPPDPRERWCRGCRGDVLELGIEVATPWRGKGVARGVLEVSFLDGALEDYIVLTTEYYWHWDLRGTSLNPYQYRTMLTRLFGSVGLEPRGTDEPDIASHPANMLMVRMGRRVVPERVLEFETLRYENRGFF
ncbi:MAG: hypothetical protein M1602_06935 [Firmicutes bacterium]|nr:hypothetical protein [Bacillota bacterium]